MSEPKILRPATLPAVDRGGGIRTVPLVTAARGSRQMLSGITLLEPGAAVPLHFHNCEEGVMLLEGQVIAHIDGVEYPLEPRDTVWIPAGVRHFLRNASESAPMAIFWTYASVDATRTIVATGITTRIDIEQARSAR